MPPNPGLRRDLKKEWGLVARKSPCLELSFEKKKENELCPLNCRVGRFESAAEGGVCYVKDVLAGRHRGGWYATWQLQNYVPKREFHLQNHVPKSQN